MSAAAPGAAGPAGFSALIAAYNHAAYVREALDSVAAQQFADYEIVVVDDGSTDGTGAVVAEWMDVFRAGRPNRAVLVTVANGGQSAAFEHGFAHCRGRYVCLLDSDDRWLPDKLARVAAIAAGDPSAGMIVHPVYVIDAAGRRTGDVRPKRARLSEGDLGDQVRRTGRQVAPATSGVVLRADVFRALVPMPTHGFPFGADAYLTFGASLLAPVRALAEPLAEYRMHGDGQYIARMLTPQGLRRSVDLTLTIARHFGLEEVMRRNSFFARNAFALAKLQGDARSQAAAYAQLARATAADAAFGPAERAALVGYWTLCFLSPRALFGRLWRAFQRRQTGFDKVRAPASP
jgi:glycosyltransferase involved in cell wall biosynthesis